MTWINWYPFPPLPREQPDDGPECSGICMTAEDIGLPEYGNTIACPHPECEKHGGGSQ